MVVRIHAERDEGRERGTVTAPRFGKPPLRAVLKRRRAGALQDVRNTGLSTKLHCSLIISHLSYLPAAEVGGMYLVIAP
jgi:hypothetical protein